MYDKQGNRLNKAQVIHGLDKLKMAYLLDDIKKNPEKYPNNRDGWIDWLNLASGYSIDNL